jgi:signal transduction histidine kinase
MKRGAGSTDALFDDGHGIAALAIENGKLVAANGAARDLFGRVAIGADARSLFDAGSARKLEAGLEAGAPSVCELQVLREGAPDPTPVRFAVLREVGGRSVLLAPRVEAPAYSEEQGRLLLRLNDELAATTRELSRRVRELADARDKLERLDAIREQLVTTLAHDLKSPLAAVRFVAAGFVSHAGALPPDEVRASGERIERAVARMVRLIDVVLADAKLETNELRLARKRVGVDEIARGAVDLLEPLAQEKRITIALDASGDTFAHVDPTWMHEVLVNLVGNALRHAPRASTIRLSIAGNDTRVCAAVADSGPGVPPGLRDAIFERFRQGSTEAGAAGLGLNVARRLVEMHGGRIWVEDAEGGGARFCFEIPKTAADALKSRPGADARS